MTPPREPDRYDKAALEIWGGDFTPAGFAAALRREHDAALDEAAQVARRENSDWIANSILALKQTPAAAPAAETEKALVSQGKAEPPYPPCSQAAASLAAPPSEPVAPAPDLRDVEHIDVLIAEFADDPKAALACIGEYVGLRLHNRKPPGAGEGTT